MNTLVPEVVNLVIKKVDTSTQLSLWWTAKRFRSFIRLPELTRTNMVAYPARDGNIQIVKWLHSLKFPANYGSCYAAGLSENLECVKYFSSCSMAADVDRGVCQSGNIEMYKFLKEKRGKKFHLLWQDVIQGGNIEMMEDCVAKYGRVVPGNHISILLSGHLHLAKWMLKENYIFLSNQICYAIDKGVKREIIELIINKDDVSVTILQSMIQNCRIDLLEIINLENVDKSEKSYMKSAYSIKDERQFLTMVRWLHEKGFVWSNNVRRKVCAFDDMDLVKHALSTANLDSLKISFISNLDLLKYIQEKRVLIDFQSVLSQAILTNNTEIVRYFRKELNISPMGIYNYDICSVETFQLLYDDRVPFNPLSNYITKFYNEELILYLIEKNIKCDVGSRSRDREPTREISSRFLDAKSQRFLATEGKLLPLQKMFESGRLNWSVEVISSAAKNKHREIVQYAIENGCRISPDGRAMIAKHLPDLIHLLK